MKLKATWHIAAILIITLLLGFIDLPASIQTKILPYTPQKIQDLKINLGLDLKGGSQLDYTIDLRKVPEEDKAGVIESVNAVIEDRVNNLGVSEPNIYLSEIAGEQHIIVELAGVDIDEAKAAVGKTIQLEFKEEKQELDPNEKDKILNQAKNLITKAKEDPEKFAFLAEKEATTFPGKVAYQPGENYFFTEQINDNYSDIIKEMQPGQIYDEPIDLKNTAMLDENGGYVMLQGYEVLKLLDVKDAEKKPDFGDLALKYSEEPNAQTTKGMLPGPARKTDSPYEESFTNAALTLNEPGEIYSQPVETSFGYHIIQAGQIADVENENGEKEKNVFVSHILIQYKDADRAGENITRSKEEALQKAKDILAEATIGTIEKQYKYDTLFFSTAPDQWQDTKLTGKQFKNAALAQDPNTKQLYIVINFDEEGAKLFEELSEKNVGKQIAMFVGGKLISAPRISEKISGGSARITQQGGFDLNAASTIVKNLNTGAIGAPLILTGQYTIGASLGHEALSKSLEAGIIGLILLAIFMIFYYRALGIIATIALTTYSIILIFLIKIALPTGIAIGISAILFMILTHKIINSRDSGWEKLISFIVATFVLFLFSLILSTPITLTLAGIAGVILSIGIAVDANVLIFERMKEEFKEGKTLASSIEIGFDRAWSSIRDSNFSTLITCVILLWFGSSLIKGFAFNLAMGVLISMFSAITVTKTLLKSFIGTKISKNKFLFCINEKKEKKGFKFVKNRKAWYGFSIILIIGTILVGTIGGFNLGRDFTGGTFLNLKFEKEASIEEINSVITETEKEINANIESTIPKSESETKPAATTNETNNTNVSTTNDSLSESSISIATETADFGTPNTVKSTEDDSYIIRIKHISEANHQLLLTNLQQKFGNVEEIRFSTIGPVIGSTIKEKAAKALLIAAIMIVLYVAFAFRHIPKSVNPWRFGIATIVAVLHDLIIVTGLYLVVSHYLPVEIDSLFITAMLTILGYSVNDTIVVFDRIRENLKRQKAEESFDQIADKSLNQTIARSLNTSISTLLPLTALYFLGGESIKYFVLALIFGTLVGTYSSIFVASNLMSTWKRWADKKK